MNPSRVIVCSLLLVAVAGSAVAGPVSRRSERVERGEYFLGGPSGVGIDGQGQFSIGAVHLPPGPEKWVSVRVDNVGTEVLAEIGQNLDGVPGPEISYQICGATDQPVRIQPNYGVTVYLYNGVCRGNTPSVATMGEVVATFTRSSK